MSMKKLDSLQSDLEEFVFSIPSTQTLFNQYSDIHPDFDLPNADKIRRTNLLGYLNDVAQTAQVLLIGEAPGPWGCRFSGVPFTGERQYLSGDVPFHGVRSSKDPVDSKTRHAPPFVSMSSRIFWRVMKKHHPGFIVWNCVPLHPHHPDKVLTVRTPSLSEIKLFLPALNAVTEFFKPRKILAIGRRAESALTELGRKAQYIRHPSQGGATKFARGIATAFSERKRGNS